MRASRCAVCGACACADSFDDDAPITGCARIGCLLHGRSRTRAQWNALQRLLRIALWDDSAMIEFGAKVMRAAEPLRRMIEKGRKA